MSIRFFDREEAGTALAQRLLPLKGERDVIVLGIPAGGILVAAEVARVLDAPLAPFVLQPLTVHGHPAHPIGAVASGGVRVVDQQAVSAFHLPRRLVDEESEQAERALAQREERYGLDSLPELAGKVVIVVDEVSVTGHTLATAVRALRLLGAHTVIAAAPVISCAASVHIAALADRCVAVHIPHDEGHPATWCEDFPPVTDAQIRAKVAAAQRDQQRRQQRENSLRF
jgi:putative phosphoribosyl transferase